MLSEEFQASLGTALAYTGPVQIELLLVVALGCPSCADKLHENPRIALILKQLTLQHFAISCCHQSQNLVYQMTENCVVLNVLSHLIVPPFRLVRKYLTQT